MFHRRLVRSVLAAATVIVATTGIALTASAGQAEAATSSSSDFTLYTEPDDGFSWLYDQINDATSSIDMTMYELSDTTAEQDLVAAEQRGVDVRVILDEREESDNKAAYDYLTEDGVTVVWSWDKYYSTSRDFAVVDTDANDVAAIVNVFNADYAHESVTPGAGDDLVWSPTTPETDLLNLIDDAQYSLQIFSEEMDDSAVIDDTSIESSLNSTFQSDFAGGTPWS